MGVPINNVTRRVVYAASGTGPYNFTFEILAAGDIAVYRDNTLLTITTDYTVTINTNGTGFVTLTATPTGATQIAIVGNRTIQRTTDFVTGGDFFANTLNDELDQQTIFNQQNAEGLNRALQAPQTDPTTINMTLPAKASRANKTLSFDADGNPTPGVSAADVANAVTYATNAANSATAAAASASAASGSASSASSSASTATTQASNASTSASNASTSATNASNSASSASTSASNAATSATNASNSASAASTSATNASNSASAASTSASNASTSATNAANSATAAATSETNAAASAASAAAALDSFDDRYLGAKTADPTVDNDGNALVTGALYYRTTTPVGMKVYDGAQWIEASAAQQSLMVTYEYVATAGQTTFSGADANGATLSYVANSISVSLNGVTLRPGDDYTATNGTSVVLTSAAALNDELMVIAFAVFNVANTYTQSQVDGFTVKLTGDQTVAGTKTFSSNPALSAGTANQVQYLNGSKVLSGSANLTFDGTTLGAAQLAVNSNNISAVNSLGFRNRIINGAMVIDQRNNGASVSFAGTGAYTLDRWLIDNTTDGTISVQQSSVAPTGFTNSLLVTVTTADASLSSTQRCRVRQPIEGFNVADLGFGTAGAQSVTLSFWVRSSLTGTFGGALNNSAVDRSYPFSYTISAANTWEYKTVTVAGNTSGTWLTNSGIGLIVQFGLGIGSSFSGTAGAWAASQIMAPTGATSVVGTNGATFYITGVQLEAGSVATPFERRDYGRELLMCQRYYARLRAGTGAYTGFGAGTFGGASQGNIFLKYPTSMRASPTFSQSGCAVSDGPANIAVSSITDFFGGSDSGLAVLALASAGTQYRGAAFVANNNTAAFIDFSAEL